MDNPVPAADCRRRSYPVAEYERLSVQWIPYPAFLEPAVSELIQYY